MLVLLITGVTLKISLGLSYRWGRAERLETQSRWPSMEELSAKEAVGECVSLSIFKLRKTRELSSIGEITICDLV